MNIGTRLSGGDCFLAKGEYALNSGITDVVLKSGYSTVRNGQADDIIVPSGMGLRRLTNGDAYDFADYKVVSLEEAKSHQGHDVGKLSE